MSCAVILIADDDENDVHFLRQALREACGSLRVLDVSTGEEAMDYLAGVGRFADRELYPFPSHLFLDLKLPRRSGAEVLRWIRARADFGDLPVTVLSGSQLSVDREQALSLGAEYVVKPVEYAALLEVARRFCARAGYVPT